MSIDQERISLGANGSATLQFLGAAGTVTGSKHLADIDGDRILLDCGLFQGLKQLRERNWKPLPFAGESIDAVVLSHAHVDHSGALPLLVKQGFEGPIFCTPATADLLDIMLVDAAHIQEEDARYANRHRFSRHSPALPLYTLDDARRALALIEPCAFGEEFAVTPRVRARFDGAGHILGSAIVTLSWGESTPRRLVFSGDLGRYGRPILRDPDRIARADVLLVESTYGDRRHPGDPTAHLVRLVNEAAERRSVIVIPAFAVDRTQELLYALRDLEDRGVVPALPIYLDSPMAIRVTDLYLRHREEHDPDMRRQVERGSSPLLPRHCRFTPQPEDSRALNELGGPMILVSASGMATGGRVLHHLARRLPDPGTTVLLIGYQAAGTRGRTLEEGGQALWIHGREVPVRARVVKIDGFSAHADQGEILRWLGGFERPPGATYCVHGEPQASDTLAAEIRHRLRWPARVAGDGQLIDLG